MPSILVVDDEEVTRMMIRRVLTGYGFDVAEAVNGRAALELAADQVHDLILMDVRMPEMNGFDACRALRSRPRTMHTPVLMLTALDDVMAATMAFEAGATDFITKPINWTLLAQRVRYALRTAAIERDLRASQLALARAHRMARLGHWRLDLRTGAIDCGRDFRELIGLGERVPMTVAQLRPHIPPDDRRQLLHFVHTLRKGSGEQDAEFRYQAPGQMARYLAVCGDVETDDDGRARALRGVIQDITARRSAEARLSYRAHFDEVTGLPNRVLFRDRLDIAIAAARTEGHRLAVFVVDVDMQHKIEAAFPQTGADRMIKAVAQRLREAASEGTTVSRLDGNSFALLLAEVADERDAAALASRLMAAFIEPLAVGERELMIGAVAGVAVYPQDGDNADELLLHASAAKARSHQAHGPGYQFFTPEMQARVVERLETEVALYRGLERGEFELHYQPKIDLRQGRTVGVEALLRWNRPGQGLQPPDSFIPLLEQTGLIMDTGDWVLHAACLAVRDLPLTLAVNMSPSQFRHPKMSDRLHRILEETGFPAHRLELEITEQVVMHDRVRTIDMLHELSERGIRVSLDDYGTGFSSLQRLKELPLHALKIDKSFVTAVAANRDDLAIVRSTVDLCHQLGLVVVAEGVEDEATMALLESIGCDIVQGYGVCRPLPLEGLTNWLVNSEFSPLAPD